MLDSACFVWCQRAAIVFFHCNNWLCHGACCSSFIAQIVGPARYRALGEVPTKKDFQGRSAISDATTCMVRRDVVWTFKWRTRFADSEHWALALVRHFRWLWQSWPNSMPDCDGIRITTQTSPECPTYTLYDRKVQSSLQVAAGNTSKMEVATRRARRVRQARRSETQSHWSATKANCVCWWEASSKLDRVQICGYFVCECAHKNVVCQVLQLQAHNTLRLFWLLFFAEATQIWFDREVWWRSRWYHRPFFRFGDIAWSSLRVQ